MLKHEMIPVVSRAVAMALATWWLPVPTQRWHDRDTSPPKKPRGPLGDHPQLRNHGVCVCARESICMDLPTSNMAMENR